MRMVGSDSAVTSARRKKVLAVLVMLVMDEKCMVCLLVSG
jgi:hypothetical protein